MSETDNIPTTAPPSSIRLVATLGGIAMMSGLLVAVTFQLTLEPIRRNRQAALEKAIFQVLPEASSRVNLHIGESGLERLPDEAIAEANAFAGYNEAGELTGVAMEGSARGYQDVVRVLYGYSPDSECITGITVLQSNETPGLGDRVESDPDFLANFECLDARLNQAGSGLANEIVTVKNGEKVNAWEIDAISGATVTSAAIGRALNSSAAEKLPALLAGRELLHEAAPVPERNPQ